MGANREVNGASPDINTVFSPLLAELLARAQENHKAARKTFLRKPKSNFAFTLADTVVVLRQQCAHSRDQALRQLQRFVDAHLLHLRDYRLASQLDALRGSTYLQPTAKGLAFLQKWFYTHGAPSSLDKRTRSAIFTVLESEWHTMQLFEFERSFLGRKILISAGVIVLLWSRMLGHDPHFYDLETLEASFGGPMAMNGENAYIYRGIDGQPGPANLSRGFKSSFIFNPTMLSTHNLFDGARDAQKLAITSSSTSTSPKLTSSARSSTNAPRPRQSRVPSSSTAGSDCTARSSDTVDSEDSSLRSAIHDENLQTVVSPHYHPIMMHPNSRAVMQYWDSRGIRLFRNVNFSRPPKSRLSRFVDARVANVMSGHAILQWLMDCTSVESVREGVSIAQLLLRNRLVTGVEGQVLDLTAVPTSSTAPKSAGPVVPPELSPRYLYRIAPRGRRLCMWSDLMPESDLDVAEQRVEQRRATRRLNERAAIANAVSNQSANAGDADPLGDLAEALTEALSNPEPLFGPDIWAWEHHQRAGPRSSGFEQIVDLPLVLREPALKILFRQEIARAQCTESLLCLDACQHLLLLFSVYRDAFSTVTRSEHLQTQIRGALSALNAHFLAPGGSLELNLSEVKRQSLQLTFKLDSTSPVLSYLDRIERGVNELQMLVKDLLRDVMAQFATSERVHCVPGLVAYINARYHSLDSAPASKATPPNAKAPSRPSQIKVTSPSLTGPSPPCTPLTEFGGKFSTPPATASPLSIKLLLKPNEACPEPTSREHRTEIATNESSTSESRSCDNARSSSSEVSSSVSDSEHTTGELSDSDISDASSPASPASPATKPHALQPPLALPLTL